MASGRGWDWQEAGGVRLTGVASRVGRQTEGCLLKGPEQQVRGVLYLVDYTKNVNKQMSKQKCSFSCLKSTYSIRGKKIFWLVPRKGNGSFMSPKILSNFAPLLHSYGYSLLAVK